MVDLLPPRLAAVADQVPQDAILVDVGTDHAQLPVHMVGVGRVKQAFALDIARGPLSRAQASTRGYADQIVVRQSDGLAALMPGEVNCIAIAGMGGLSVARILTEGAEVCAAAERIIVQPQGMEAEVRVVLLSMGWSCIHGRLVRDRKHLYVVEAWEPLVDRQSEPQAWSPEDLRWGKLIRANPDPLYGAWLEHALADVRQGLQRLSDAGQSEHPDAHLLRKEEQKLVVELASL